MGGCLMVLARWQHYLFVIYIVYSICTSLRPSLYMDSVPPSVSAITNFALDGSGSS